VTSELSNILGDWRFEGLQGGRNGQQWVNQHPSNLYTARNNSRVGAVTRLMLIPLVNEGYMLQRKNKKERLDSDNGFCRRHQVSRF